jgi:predicted permease
MWTWNFPSQLAQDTRFAFRTMASKPVFTAMAVLSLALGIGANTAIYSFMDAILMRTIPVPHPSQLAVFNWRATGRSPFPRRISGTGHREPNGGVSSPNYPYAAYEMFRANTDVLSSVVAYAWTRDLTVIARQQAESAAGLFVSGNFYAGLGVVPAAGRLIDADDDRLGAPPVAVIGYQYWQRRFGCDPSAVGLSILIDNTPFTIVGVSAPGFSGVDHAVEPLFFLPIHAEPLFSTEPAADVERRFFDKNYYWLEMIGRLRPGVSLERAQSALALRFSQFVGSHAATAANRAAYPALFLQEGATGLDSLRRAYSKPVYILMAMVGLILVIACANIANLLLARAASRRREMAVRLSLGAGRWRVVRQLLTESAALASMGGLLGVLVAVWGIRTITWLLANGRDDFHLRATIDWPVLGFTLALTVLTGIVFGLAPALQATRVDLTPALKQARASAPRRRSGLRLGLGQTLVVVQIAISLLLVVGAGLFVHTLSNLHSIPLGFNSENVLVFNLNARQAGYRGDDSGRFYAGLKDRFRAIPGVRSVTFSGSPLVDFYWDSQGVFLPGAPETSGKPRETALVTNRATWHRPTSPWSIRSSHRISSALKTRSAVPSAWAIPGNSPASSSSASPRPPTTTL